MNDQVNDHQALFALRPAGAVLAALAPTEIEVQDDSHLHAGHAGAREGGHYTVRLRSERFTGLASLARHRLVYSSLGPLGPLGVHALAIEARAPGET
jgi:BolA family transcriptional regulator, general stress-responsive regulator